MHVRRSGLPCPSPLQMDCRLLLAGCMPSNHRAQEPQSHATKPKRKCTVAQQHSMECCAWAHLAHGHAQVLGLRHQVRHPSSCCNHQLASPHHIPISCCDLNSCCRPSAKGLPSSDLLAKCKLCAMHFCKPAVCIDDPLRDQHAAIWLVDRTPLVWHIVACGSDMGNNVSLAVDNLAHSLAVPPAVGNLQHQAAV